MEEATRPTTDHPSSRYTVAVRTLCDFTGRGGDLDARFSSPSPSALEGIAGHTAVTARRPAHYEREVALSGRYDALAVRGRADGFDPVAGRLEEIKTHRGDLSRQPARQRLLHWAQAEVYGWLLCDARGLVEIELALVYYDIGTGAETVVTRRHSAESLHEAFESRCRRFLAWARSELAHRAARDAALATLRFPFDDFRAGQRPLAEAVYRSQRDGLCLMAQAPTGIGKTIATLFPALRACPPAVPTQESRPGLDRVFFLTARTSGRQLALDAQADLRAANPGLPLRVLELVARDKACEYPDRACNGDSCPLARGFYDRLAAARAQAAASPVALDRATTREIALAHGVCPYYLAQEMARWSDLVVGDVNHWFDGSALLFALAMEAGWRCGLLVDEAHNLVERARGMYSARLDPVLLAVVRQSAPATLKRPLERLRRAWKALAPDDADATGRREFDMIPAGFLRALQDGVAALGDTLAESPGGADTADLQRLWFDLLAFARRAEAFGAHSLFDATRLPGRTGVQLDIRNLVPAPFVAARFAAARAATLFSATLRPERYHRDLLGLPADTASLDVPSPYAAEQLQVRIARHISTRWQHREQSLPAVADLLAAQFEAAPGNYLAFFSSFDYLQRALDSLQTRHPTIPVWAQSRGMGEPERDAFLRRFAAGGQGIGFAVLGGVFGEGIDLPGDRLVGAFIATLGLPQVNPVNERRKQRLQTQFGADQGYDYAYLLPGMQKVVQAAGRVIRSASDRGVVWLMDDRFDQPRHRRLLPHWWHVESVAGPALRPCASHETHE
ncbi:ATP-dependent DNA helicase [Xylophilus sp. GOD-11R]|uniref:ATP-dependent DNA helicase n=1 Tax=Xylophilus sp. GOD-11R TaxID=3089814 RepID=UPI00298C825B|nr:ATP-dependent DNA helicase [Xylophilus sp. GOD-11R]WPB57305.1 ATP-dependent DNA helicase [Xylophilus sp. GOD-11R]